MALRYDVKTKENIGFAALAIRTKGGSWDEALIAAQGQGYTGKSPAGLYQLMNKQDKTRAKRGPYKKKEPPVLVDNSADYQTAINKAINELARKHAKEMLRAIIVRLESEIEHL